MVVGLKRYQDTGHLHFVTFSCYRRQPYLGAEAARGRFEKALERTRELYELQVIGYVVMPEHVHLLVSEPRRESLAKALQSLKIYVARRSRQSPFWQARSYDFNVFTEGKRVEKPGYMHRNPVRHGMVETVEAWEWSSGRFYLLGDEGRVEIGSDWAMHWKPARIRPRTLVRTWGTQKIFSRRCRSSGPHTENPHLRIEMWATRPGADERSVYPEANAPYAAFPLRKAALLEPWWGIAIVNPL